MLIKDNHAIIVIFYQGKGFTGGGARFFVASCTQVEFLTGRVAAKQHFQNFANTKFGRNYFYFRETIDFREIISRNLHLNFATFLRKSQLF